jgi:hypothetical protein
MFQLFTNVPSKEHLKHLCFCDVSKIHTGFGIMPKVTHTTDDKDWGKPGSCKKVYVAKSITQRGGFASVDNLIERKENQYWIIQVDNFQSWMLSFYKFVGRWETEKLANEKIRINYTYCLHSNNLLLFPILLDFWQNFLENVYEKSFGKY